MVSEKSTNLNEKELHLQRVIVWCAIMCDRIIGPYIFENQENFTETVIGERFWYMFNTFLRPVVIHLRNRHELWFQQDEATCNTANETIDVLQEMFSNSIIFSWAALTWPTRSPDLNVPDYHLWRYLKERVYINRPENIEELMDNIRWEICVISPATLRSVMNNALE